MATNIFAVSYDIPKKFIELAVISDEDIKKISKATNPQIKLIRFLDPYDNTFFNRKQIKELLIEFNMLEQENNYQIKELINSLKTSIDNIFINEEYSYLVFLGD